LGKKWRELSISALVAAARPAGVRIAKPDADLQPSRQFRVAGHPAATVVSHEPAQHGGQAFQLAGKPLQRNVDSAAALPSVPSKGSHH